MFGRDDSAAMDIAGVNSEAAAKSGAEFRQHGSEQDIELVLLASAGAIQRLIAERNALRARVEAQERELTRLQRHVALIHDSYRRLTNEFVTQFQLIDNAVSNFVRDPGKPVVALAEEDEPTSDA
jgi:predicted RNase H-like nuclease (RuvC/YqgF family)